MTMRDLVNAIAFANSVTPQTIAGADLTGIGVDLAGFGSATVVLVLGDIDELGGSPVGSAKIDLRLQHSDDNASWSDVTDADVIGLSGVTAVTNGVAASTTGAICARSCSRAGSATAARPARSSSRAIRVTRRRRPASPSTRPPRLRGGVAPA